MSTRDLLVRHERTSRQCTAFAALFREFVEGNCDPKVSMIVHAVFQVLTRDQQLRVLAQFGWKEVK